MKEDRGISASVDAEHSLQPFVLLLGTSLQFSDQMLRLLHLEFPDVRFERTCEGARIPAEPRPPELVIIHGSAPDLPHRIDEVAGFFPNVMIAIACNNPSIFRHACQSGASRRISFLQLNTPIEVWLAVLRLLLCGHQYVPAEVAGSLDTELASVPPEQEPEAAAPLTPREMQILPMIARGLQNKTIAGELGLSEHTVKLHTHNIFSKLGVSNRTGAASWYLSRSEGAGGHADHVK